uniref:Vacuolar protein sorting-associated protein 51 homolog n=1 Tax=Steinernema glaseri TaxID=37863 RepID=A0A1I8A9N8_9BILA
MDKVDHFVAKLEQNFLVYLKTALANLLLFTASDVTFSGFETTQFAAGFGIDVHEGVVIGCLEDLCALADGPLGDRKATPPFVMLIVAQFIYNTQGKSLAYIIDLCQEQFRLAGHRDRKSKKLTKTEAITVKVQQGAEQLLKKYVDARAAELSQLIVNGVESRDWLSCGEPRAVRSVMKRFVEHLENIDTLLKQIMDSDATKKERTPESVRASSAARARNIHNFDTGSLSSTLERMWTEKIEFFENVQFKRASVLSSIVKICLKSFLESVRMQTFGRYGLEQIQVDCYFLQQQLWKYVSDEAVVTSMIDEIVSSVVHRSVQPKIMEPGAVKEICDRA